MQPRRLTPRVVEEAAVAIDRNAGSLMDDGIDALIIQIRCETRPLGAGDAVNRPQVLADAIDQDVVPDLPARVRTGKRTVLRWMPILSRDDVLVVGHGSVCHLNH